MGFLPNLLKGVIFNKLYAIEDKPLCILRKHTASSSSSPFSGSGNILPQYTDFVIPVLYVPESEIVNNNNVITTTQQIYFYFNEDDLLKRGISNITVNDIIVFPYPINNQTSNYSPKEITYIFGIWKVRVIKL